MSELVTPPLEAAKAIRTGLRDHPLRATVSNEVHARPFETIQAPVRASHLALLSGADAAAAEREHVAQLCRQCGAAPPPPGADYHSAQLGALRLRWERHTEFSTYTFFCHGVANNPLTEPALDQVPVAWLQGLPGELLVGVHLAVESAQTPVRPVAQVLALFGADHMAGSYVGDGSAVVWTDFRLQADGFGRILVQDVRLGERQAGRLIQRLLELETYRLMALLAFPLAREVGPELARLDQALHQLTDRMIGSSGLEDQQVLLDELSVLASRVEQINARTSYRLGAARAYYDLVQRRIDSLKEQKIQDLQPIGKFMERRLAPAMSTCESVGERQELLAQRVMRAGNLLRTRVDVALEAQNRDLLESMNGRAKMQLRLQQTVEGLSVVVLSYYAMGLLGYALKAGQAAGLPLRADITLGLAVPLVVGGIWLAMRWLHHRIMGHDQE